MLAVRMVAEVEKRRGINLPLAALFRKPTIEHLAELIRDPGKSGPASALIPLNQQTAGVPLFCIHPAGGTVFCYRELAGYLAEERPVFGLQAQGVDGRELPHQDLSEMAAYYVEAIRQITGPGPCHLLGWSIGGNIAYEVARQLSQTEIEVSSLTMLDSGLLNSEEGFDDQDFLPLIAALFPGDEHLSLEQLRDLSTEEQLEYFIRQASQAGIVPVDAELLGMQIFSVFQANIKAVHSYQTLPYAGRLTLVRPSDQTRTGELFDDPALGWRQYVDAVDVVEVSGDHAGMLRGRAADEIAELLRHRLRP